LALYILSPLDALPDVIPVLGQIDDGGALIGTIITGLSGALAWWSSKQSKSYRTDGTGGPPLPPGP
jgi:uncharacterized membrane protein YkvA (DUF1232 family)